MTRGLAIVSLAGLVLVGLDLVLGYELLRRPVSEPPAISPSPVSDSRVGNFGLLDQQGRHHELYYYARDRAVVIYVHAIDCPVVTANLAKLDDLSRAYAARGVRFYHLNSTQGDTRERLQAHADQFGFKVPILMDPDQIVMDQLGVERTGSALVIDTALKKVVYRGPVDDQVALEVYKPSVKHRYLRDALEGLLRGLPVASPRVRDLGCVITRLAPRDPPGPSAYADEVAPILREKCVTCHRPNGAAPWAMTDHAAVRRWAAMMKEVVLTRRMPPWHADPAVGSFANDASLTSRQKRTMIDWIDAGAPRGSDPDPLAAQADPPPEWPLGPPDVILEVPPIDLPATGVLDYQYPIVRTGFDRDVWVRAAVIAPSNKAVTHHALAFLEAPLRGPAALSVDDWIAVYSPGVDLEAARASTTIRDAAHLVPKGSSVYFQIHYVPTGRPVQNTMKLGLYLQKERPKHQLRTMGIASHVEIPPYAPDYPARAEGRFDRDVTMYALFPHMHYRGNRAEFTAIYGDGRQETLLRVPQYRFNWQTIYRLAEPRRLPAGTVVRVTGSFDNSEDNPLNPDPSATVRYGPQSTDEMFIGYVIYGVPPGQ